MAHLHGEFQAIITESIRQARAYRVWGRVWKTAHILLGLPATVLAAFSGATGLSSADARIPAAVLALTSAGFAAAFSFLQSDAKAARAKRCRNAWLVIEADARLSAAIDGYRAVPEMHRALVRLLEQRRAILAEDFDRAFELSQASTVTP